MLLSLLTTLSAIAASHSTQFALLAPETLADWLLSGAPLTFIAMAPVGAIVSSGSASGSFKVGDETIEIKHAYAHMHDNAEGIFDGKREMRILLVDREVDPSCLIGAVGLEVVDMGEDGEVRGVLLKFDPDKNDWIGLTPLIKQDDPELSLGSVSLSNTSGLWEELKLEGEEVSGKLQRDYAALTSFGDPPFGYTFEFTAPIAKEPPVTETLEGKAAVNSPQAKANRASLEAMKAGDFSAYAKTLSRRALKSRRNHAARYEMEIEQMFEMMREGVEEELATANSVAKVVVRGDRAIVIIDDKNSGTQWVTVRKEDGAWKVD